jgi:hypothetical protein
MTAAEIADRLVRREDLGITHLRVLKLRALCERMGVPLADVLTYLTPEQRQAVQDAS